MIDEDAFFGLRGLHGHETSVLPAADDWGLSMKDEQRLGAVMFAPTRSSHVGTPMPTARKVGGHKSAYFVNPAIFAL